MTKIIDENRPPDLVAWQDETAEMAPAQRAELKDFILERNAGKITPAHMRLRQTALDTANILDQFHRIQDLAATSLEAQTICVVSDRVMRRLADILRAAAYNTR